MLNPRKRMRQITKHAFSNIHANSGIEMTIWPWDILVPVRYLNLRVLFVAMATAGQIWLGLWFLWSTYMANYIYNIHFRVLPLVTVFVFPLPPPLKKQPVVFRRLQVCTKFKVRLPLFLSELIKSMHAKWPQRHWKEKWNSVRVTCVCVRPVFFSREVKKKTEEIFCLAFSFVRNKMQAKYFTFPIHGKSVQ